MRVLRYLIVSLVFVSSSVISAEPPEVVLLPVMGTVSGVDSSWGATAYMTNVGLTSVFIGTSAFPFGPCVQLCPSELPPGATHTFFAWYTDLPATLVYVSAGSTDAVRFSVAVTEVRWPKPVAIIAAPRERDFGTTVHLFPVGGFLPSDRILLRVYDPDAVFNGRARVDFRALDSGVVEHSLDLTLATSTARDAGLPVHPGYAQVEIASPVLPERLLRRGFRVDVSALQPTRRVWAMVTATSSDSRVTVVRPSQ